MLEWSGFSQLSEGTHEVGRDTNRDVTQFKTSEYCYAMSRKKPPESVPYRKAESYLFGSEIMYML